MTLKEARQSKGLTQQEVSERLGISVRTMKRWESHGAKKYQLELIAKVYDVNVNELKEAQ